MPRGRNFKDVTEGRKRRKGADEDIGHVQAAGWALPGHVLFQG